MTETLCRRCHEHPAVEDAAAYEQPGTHAPYDARLDDVCEDCLEAAQQELDVTDHDEAIADLVARQER